MWDRRRLLLTLSAVAVAALVMVAGLGYALYLALSTAGASTSAGETQVVESSVVVGAGLTGLARRDAIAAAPMLAVPAEAGRSGTPAAHPAPGIEIPAAGEVGPVDVPTGYPRTPQGALGQLAAITVSVLQSMSIEHTRAVHEAWSMPGAPPVEEWELMRSVQAFLGSAAGPYADSPSTAVALTPAAAQVKGVDGDDWTLACVLFDVQARVVTTARVAYGHCERMQWSEPEGRWVIAVGAAPARAPSTWPGTQIASEAGWLTWVPAQAK